MHKTPSAKQSEKPTMNFDEMCSQICKKKIVIPMPLYHLYDIVALLFKKISIFYEQLRNCKVELIDC